MLERLSQKLTDIVRRISGKAFISEKNVTEALDEIKMALLEADVSLRVVRRFLNTTLEQALGAKVTKGVNPSQQFIKIIYDKLVELLGGTRTKLNLKGPDTQTVILCIGLQGSGKTTTAAKLALSLKKEGRRPLLVAADLVRPAAVLQLVTLGRQAQVECYYEENAKNPLAVIKNALKKAKQELLDTVILDTAGRLQIDDSLMLELEQIKKQALPDETILVADAMTGQQAVDIAKTFSERIGITGVILTKFDSDTRGGAALSIKTISGQPIYYLGNGEKLDELEPFYPERIASRILGKGDIISLVEKAEQVIAEDELKSLQEKMTSNSFDFNDYLLQYRRIKKMGSLKSLLEMIPGLQGNIDSDKIDLEEMKREEAIILSMTKEERCNPLIIGPSRRRRIAHGSGTAVFEVNKLLKKFEKTKLMMRKMVKNKNLQQQVIGTAAQDL